MPRDIAEICHDIDDRRERLNATAVALGWKLDLPARARDTARETVQVIRDRVAAGSVRPAEGGTQAGVGERVDAVREGVRDTVSAAQERTHAAAEAVGEGLEGARERLGSASDAVAGGIESARDHLGSAADAVADGVQSARERVGGAAGTVGERLSSASGTVAEGTRSAGRLAARIGRETADGSSPTRLLVGALALGVIAGVAVPATARERRLAADAVDELRDRAEEAGHAAVARGEEAVEAVMEGART